MPKHKIQLSVMFFCFIFQLKKPSHEFQKFNVLYNRNSPLDMSNGTETACFHHYKYWKRKH